MRFPRLIHYLLVAYMTFFLNVLLPGHTRGAITTDGKHSVAPCCCCCGGSEKQPESNSPSAPSGRDREHCAICQFAAGLTTPPVMTLTLPEHGLLEIIPVTTVAGIFSLDRISTYLACGPPLSTATSHV